MKISFPLLKFAQVQLHEFADVKKAPVYLYTK